MARCQEIKCVKRKHEVKISETTNNKQQTISQTPKWAFNQNMNWSKHNLSEKSHTRVAKCQEMKCVNENINSFILKVKRSETISETPKPPFNQNMNWLRSNLGKKKIPNSVAKFQKLKCVKHKHEFIHSLCQNTKITKCIK